jgi:hypothetical protein
MSFGDEGAALPGGLPVLGCGLAADPPTFEKDVRPILDHCLIATVAVKARSNLDCGCGGLPSRGRQWGAIVPGKPRRARWSNG